MNNNIAPEEQKKPKFSKPVAVAGFVAAIAFIAWVSVQIVSFIPNAFSSLASIADGISQYSDSMSVNNDEQIVISSDTKLADAGKPVVVTWGKDSREGTYAFSYKCMDGVSVDIVDADGLRNITCDTRYSLGVTDTVTVIVNSEKERFVDVPYTISFMRPNDTGPIRSGDSALTITNSSVSEAIVKADTTGVVLGENDTKVETPVAKPKPVVTTISKKPVVIAEPVTEYVYELPVSNPNGFTDLATKFLNVGDIRNGRFVAGSIEKNGSGAFQFEIKNFGTKTSESWSYTVALPDGDTYTSPKQAALKPNERAVISISFDTQDDNAHTFVVVLKVEDKTASNNSFKQAINFTK